MEKIKIGKKVNKQLDELIKEAFLVKADIDRALKMLSKKTAPNGKST